MEALFLIGALGACLYYMLVIGKKDTPKNKQNPPPPANLHDSEQQSSQNLQESEPLPPPTAPARSEIINHQNPPKTGAEESMFSALRNKNRDGDSGADSDQSAHPSIENALSIENVGKGGFIALYNVGDDMKDYEGQVLAKHVYCQNDYTWHELECESEHGKIWVTVERDDELTVTVITHKPSFADLGITAADLEDMEEAEEARITYQGETFTLEESDEADFYRNGDEDAVSTFEFWDFYNADSSKVISVENWGNSEFDLSYGVEVAPRQIKVFSLG